MIALPAAPAAAKTKQPPAAAALLQQAPLDLGQLPAWFTGLTPAQLRSVWVAAVIECYAAAPAGKSNITALAAALRAVRDHDGGKQ